jgi:hypothetical protein
MSTFTESWLPNIVCGFLFYLLSLMINRDTALRWVVWFAHQISQLSHAGSKITVATGPLSVGSLKPPVIFGGNYPAIPNRCEEYTTAWAVIQTRCNATVD